MDEQGNPGPLTRCHGQPVMGNHKAEDVMALPAGEIAAGIF